MRIMTTVAELNALGHDLRRGAVFTMGALHAGHAALMAECRERIGADGLLIVTIFVNPTQFGDPKDLERYPRTPEADLALCEAAGVDVVFMPSVEEMYPVGVELFQPEVGELDHLLEGAARPGHFSAVARVVHRLISVTAPDLTCFGEKDFQQLVVVRRLVSDSGLNCEVIGVPTIREADGLALSSRNRLLSAAARSKAPLLHNALERVAALLLAGESAESALAGGRSVIDAEPAFELDYLVLADTELNTSHMPKSGTAWHGRALVAARIDGIRLIDNISVEVKP